MEPSEDGANWSAAPAELAHRIFSTTLHLGIGIALSMVAVKAMRRNHLRWTWALVAFAFVVLARSALGSWTATLVSAALWAAVRGRSWHSRDIYAGADLAAIAAARRGPSQALVGLLRMLARTHHSDIPQGGSARQQRVALGRAESGELASIPVGTTGAGRHTLVVGATGSGKTYTLSWILAQAIERGMGAVVVDPKGDEYLRAQLARAAHMADRPLLEWTPHGPSVYNPFAHGPASAIADKALAGERFTEPHYQRQAQRYLGHAVHAMRATSTQVSLRTLVEQLDPDRLDALARSLPESEAEATYEYLDALTPRQRADLAGVRDRLAIMAESDVAPWLDPATPDTQAFDLLTAVEEGAIVRFSLESDTWPLLAHMLAVAIVQDLQTVVSALQARPRPTLVVIDEFSAISPGHVVRLFGRARSAGVSLLLGTQELSDLRLPGHERLLDQVLGNLSSLVAHRQVVPDSAELIARLAGTRGAWRGSQSSNGRWTRTRTSIPLLDPEQIRSLPPGWAAVVEPGGLSHPLTARIFSPDRPGVRRTVATPA